MKNRLKTKVDRNTPSAKTTPIDLLYIYLSGGLFDGDSPCASCATSCTAAGHTCANSAGQGGCAWWGCYQYDMDPPGEIVRTMISTAKAATPPGICAICRSIGWATDEAIVSGEAPGKLALT